MPTGPWIDDTDLKQRLADILQVKVQDLSSIKATTITDSNRSAWLDCVSALLLRGYSQAQIDQWDRRAEFNTDIALYWSFVKGRLPVEDGTVQVDKLDRRKELITLVVTVNGEPILPEAAVAGDQVVSGGRVAAAYVKRITRDNGLFPRRFC